MQHVHTTYFGDRHTLQIQSHMPSSPGNGGGEKKSFGASMLTPSCQDAYTHAGETLAQVGRKFSDIAKDD